MPVSERGKERRGRRGLKGCMHVNVSAFESDDDNRVAAVIKLA